METNHLLIRCYKEYTFRIFHTYTLYILEIGKIIKKNKNIYNIKIIYNCKAWIIRNVYHVIKVNFDVCDRLKNLFIFHNVRIMYFYTL